MKRLFVIEKLVKEILTDIPDTRNSDDYLYLKVLERVAALQGMTLNLSKMSVPYFLCNVQKLNFPYYASVSRARRKLKAAHPELRGTEKVEAVRQEKEKVFREYARAEAPKEDCYD